MFFIRKKRCHIAWINPANGEVSWMKGQRTSFFWDRGFDSDVIAFASSDEAHEFANLRVKVPYKVKLPPRG